MKNILLTGGRSMIALEMARLLHASGHRVIVAETDPWHVCRFSNAISNAILFLVPGSRMKILFRL